MTNIERRTATTKFVADRKGRGKEKQETQAFGLALLQKVYDIEAIAAERTRKAKLEAFQRKLAGLKFFEIKTRSLIQFRTCIHKRLSSVW